jgi:hypothetical protein
MDKIEQQAQDLSVKLNCQVLPIVFHDEETNQDIVGFIKEPSRVVKLRVMDKAMTSPVTAAAELFESVFIAEASDARFLTEDKFFLGGTMEAFKTVEMAVNTFKKK